MLRHKMGGNWVPLSEAASQSSIGAQSILWTVATSVGKRGRRMEIREVGLQGLEVRAVPK
jgi:hypothetical protein